MCLKYRNYNNFFYENLKFLEKFYNAKMSVQISNMKKLIFSIRDNRNREKNIFYWVSCEGQ